MKNIFYNKISVRWDSNLYSRSLKSFITVFILSASFLLAPVLSKAQAEGSPPPTEIGINVSSPDNGDNYCPYKGVTFTAPTNFYIPKYGYITYSWTFDQANNPSNYFSSSNQANHNPNPPLVNWDKEGTFTVSVTVTVYNQNGSIAHVYVGSIDVSINATCCAEYLPTLTSFTLGQIYSGIYYIPQDITLPSGYGIELTGLFLMRGQATLSTPGGTVVNSSIFAESNTEFIINGGQIRGECQDMWGGIKMEDEAYIGMESAYISDSYDGIYSDPNNGAPIAYNINGSEFENNRRGITARDIDGTLNGRNFLTQNKFHCTTTEFMEPFANTAHNAGENYRMEYAVKLEGEIEMDGEHFKSNEFINAIVGVQFRMEYDFNNPALYIESNHFENNQFIGMYSENLNGMSFIEGHSFVLPIDPDVYSQQYLQFREAEFLHLQGEEAVFGEYGSDLRDIGNYSSFFSADSEDDPYFDGVKRIGIKANLKGFPIPGTNFTSQPHFLLNRSTFERLHVGAEIGNKADWTEISENRFTDNQIALHYTSNPAPNKVNNYLFNCNKFELVNANDAVQYYGMYINDSTEFYDIADNGFTGDPAGNGWPTDGTNDPSITTGSFLNVNVNLWTPPTNWFAIFDDNPSPSWTYWRYNNEFVGEASSIISVSPASIVQNAGPTPGSQINAQSSHCLAYLNIPFPQMIVLAELDLDEDIMTKVFPNPVSSGRELEIKANKAILNLNIVDLNGRIYKSIESQVKNENMSILTNTLESGFYFLNITLENGEMERVKILIE